MNNYINKKSLAFLGLGIENYALINYIREERLDCRMTVFDKRPKEALINAYPQFAKEGIALLESEKFKSHTSDLIVRSPGWPLFDPLLKSAVKSGSELTSAMRIFFRLSPSTNIIGVTGTKGKGTTSSLIFEILKQAGKKVFLGGNIGIAPFGFINKIKRSDWVVLELSSFQLEDMDMSPRIAVITNFYPEHLAPADPLNPNHHRSLKAYWKAKLNICCWQGASDKLVAQFALKARLEKENLKPRQLYYDSKRPQADAYFIKDDLVLLNTQFQACVRLPGDHNKENAAGAALASLFAGAKIRDINKAIMHFHGLEHRLEFVGTVAGVNFYNDSFSTTPQSSITALKSFNQPIILLAGGAEKNSNFNSLGRAMAKKVKFLILLKGEATKRLKKAAVQAGCPTQRIKEVASIGEAARLAHKKSLAGDVVLLSPACASFGMFKNYKERGVLWKEAVAELKDNIRR